MASAIVDSRNIRMQAVGGNVAEHNKRNLEELYRKIYRAGQINIREKEVVGERCAEALKCVDNVRNFASVPEHILGSDKTKHGEIAEQTNVWFQNAWNTMKGKSQPATFDGVGRTAPEDYIVRGIKVQSKYVDGASQNLDAVLTHLEKYRNIDFGRDGSYYVIPKDYYDQIQKILSGDVEGINSRTIKAVQNKVQQIEEETRRPFSEAVRPGRVDYWEVQEQNIGNTLDRETNNLEQYADNRRRASDKKKEKQTAQAEAEAAPSWKKANLNAGIGAAVGGTMQLGVGIYRKCKEGKSIADFTADDWKTIGIDTTKAAVEGGISGYAIYGMTNFLEIPDPLAAAGTSLALGLVEMVYEFGKGHLTKEAFTENCQMLTINAAVCALGAHVGEMLIPIPVLGAVIGSVVASNILPEICGEGTTAAIKDAAYYVHGAALTALNAGKQISDSQRRAKKNISEAKIIRTETAKRIEANFAELGELL